MTIGDYFSSDIILIPPPENIMTWHTKHTKKEGRDGKELSKDIQVIEEEVLVKDLLQGICIWKSFYYTFMYEIFHRGIKSQNYGEDKNPGSLDIQQVIYLCFAKTFVMNDKPFLNHLKSIVKYSGIDTKVWDFQYFIDMISIT
ncbi:hypothetical protein [Thermoanaerobacter sp. YS13]|uniref:hypothetical protein n=1 Tax=Thermoanaerobacter sp. YS13 TaxID=1511746 RepID=UPI0007FB3D86|nr:hypothetical protein [Thermoanaerobacter sp. YS13]